MSFSSITYFLHLLLLLTRFFAFQLFLTLIIRLDGSLVFYVLYLSLHFTSSSAIAISEGWKPWDYAAGSLFVEEAGGCMSDLRTGVFDLYGSEVLAAASESLRGNSHAHTYYNSHTSTCITHTSNIPTSYYLPLSPFFVLRKGRTPAS
jgi:hypothetical protein